MILFKLNASVTKLLFIDVKSITHTKNYLVTISEILLPIFMFCFYFIMLMNNIFNIFKTKLFYHSRDFVISEIFSCEQQRREQLAINFHWQLQKWCLTFFKYYISICIIWLMFLSLVKKLQMILKLIFFIFTFIYFNCFWRNFSFQSTIIKIIELFGILQRFNDDDR